jgi:hypothetical protein
MQYKHSREPRPLEIEILWALERDELAPVSNPLVRRTEDTRFMESKDVALLSKVATGRVFVVASAICRTDPNIVKDATLAKERASDSKTMASCQQR